MTLLTGHTPGVLPSALSVINDRPLPRGVVYVRTPKSWGAGSPDPPTPQP